MNDMLSFLLDGSNRSFTIERGDNCDIKLMLRFRMGRMEACFLPRTVRVGEMLDAAITKLAQDAQAFFDRGVLPA